MDHDDLNFYRTPCPPDNASGMADAGKLAALFSSLPDDVAGLARVVQGLMLHEHLASTYGETLSDTRRGQTHIRDVAAMLDAIMSIDNAPLDFPRAPGKRLIGVCRHFTLLMVTLLRTKGYAARSRCGFGTYFEAGRFVDHWVAEYWHGSQARWVMVDAQIDDVLKAKFKTDFDVLDVPRDRFIVAGEAWAQVREGRAKAEQFGIMHMWGDWFIAGNLIRDVAALNKVEMLPWDVWDAMPAPDAPVSSKDYRRFDHMAALTRVPDMALNDIMALYDEVRVPPQVFNAVTNQVETV
ncbi:MAG: transglutaminase domain-containing protein [Parvibaculum sp.]|nr:transglutaminase domain-containing protein [Parvibaculum sp.]